MRHKHPTRIPVLLLLLPVAAFVLAAQLHAQDIREFSIEHGDDVFTREVTKVLGAATGSMDVPLLDCSVEYLRRNEGNDIVYRRGPVDLHQQGPSSGRIRVPSIGGMPASAREHPSFSGGMLVDLPRIGEAASGSSYPTDKFRYLLRIALVPERYEDGRLHARLFLERALVTANGSVVHIVDNEVYSRTVELEGNVPLRFDLPAWDNAAEQATVVPSSLKESVLLTLEIPRYFALSENEPEPFSSSTRLRFALPRDSDVKLTIRIQGEEIVLDEGRRQAGKYDLLWSPRQLPEDSFTATLNATDEQGTLLYSDQTTLTHDPHAQEFEAASPTGMTTQSLPFTLSLESGFAYQLPADQVKPMRNMFTHLVFRLGYRLSSLLEAGLIAGQDAFNQTPDERVDTERIPDYGGVVAYTFGYLGVYARILPGSTTVAPLVQLSAGVSDAALVSEIGAGIRASLHPQFEMYLLPAIMLHFTDERSAKLGIHYGASVRF